MQQFLAENNFFKHTRALGWHSTVTSDDSGNYRPFIIDADVSLENFFNALINIEYSRKTPYLVFTRGDKKQVLLSFAKFCNDNPISPKFVAMCFFPSVEDVIFALPTDAISRLPAALWETNLSSLSFGSRIVYKNKHGQLSTTTHEKSTLFSDYQKDCVAFISAQKLSEWFKTSDGKLFHKQELKNAIDRDFPNALRYKDAGLTGRDILLGHA